MYTFRIGRVPVFFEGLYLGLSLEAGNLWETPKDVDLSDLHRSFSLFLGADTALGPVYLAHGVSDSGKDSFYLFLGRTF
jgi:NTE family protein